MPTEENIRKIRELKREIDKNIKAENANRWTRSSKALYKNPPMQKVWKWIKNIKRSSPERKVRIYIKPDTLIKYYTSLSYKKFSKEHQVFLKEIEPKRSDDWILFTNQDVRRTIYKANNSEVKRPDNITTCKLKHLGHRALELLANVFNLSINTNTIPEIWKKSLIIPIRNLTNQ